MGRKSIANQRRREIVEACYRVIDKHGIENTTTKKIAGEIDLTTGLIHHYFKNKEEIIIEMMKFLMEKLDGIYHDELKTLPTAKERLNYYIDKTIKLEITQIIEDRVFYACFYMSLYNSELRKCFQDLHNMNREFSNQLIIEYLKEENLPLFNPDPCSVELRALIEGLNYLYRVYDDIEFLESCIDDFKKIFWSSLNRRIDEASK